MILVPTLNHVPGVQLDPLLTLQLRPALNSKAFRCEAAQPASQPGLFGGGIVCPPPEISDCT